MIVREWMSPPWDALPSERTLLDAVRFMNQRGAPGVVVTREGRPCGALSLAQATLALDSGDPSVLLSRTTLSSIVSPALPTISSDDPLERAARILSERPIGALPVVWNRELVGVLTPQDVCRAFCEVLGSRAWDAPTTLILTAPRGCDVLEEIRRRTGGAPLHSLLAYPTPQQDWQIHVRMRRSALGTDGFDQCA
jgi:acetoin utilization protein AcuB